MFYNCIIFYGGLVVVADKKLHLKQGFQNFWFQLQSPW